MVALTAVSRLSDCIFLLYALAHSHVYGGTSVLPPLLSISQDSSVILFNSVSITASILPDAHVFQIWQTGIHVNPPVKCPCHLEAFPCPFVTRWVSLTRCGASHFHKPGTRCTPCYWGSLLPGPSVQRSGEMCLCKHRVSSKPQ